MSENSNCRSKEKCENEIDKSLYYIPNTRWHVRPYLILRHAPLVLVSSAEQLYHPHISSCVEYLRGEHFTRPFHAYSPHSVWAVHQVHQSFTSRSSALDHNSTSGATTLLANLNSHSWTYFTNMSMLSALCFRWGHSFHGVDAG